MFDPKCECTNLDLTWIESGLSDLCEKGVCNSVWYNYIHFAGFHYESYTKNVLSLSKPSTVASTTTPTTGNTTNGNTNLTVAATAATKVTAAMQMLKTVTKNHVQVTLSALQKELMDLFGVSFRGMFNLLYIIIATLFKRCCMQMCMFVRILIQIHLH